MAAGQRVAGGAGLGVARCAAGALVGILLLVESSGAAARGSVAREPAAAARGWTFEAAAVRVELPAESAAAPARLVFADGAVLELGTAVRLLAVRPPEHGGGQAGLSPRRAAGVHAGERAVRYAGVLGGAAAELRVAVGPARVKSELVLERWPSEALGAAARARRLWLEETLVLPEGWRLAELGPGGALRATQSLPILDARGRERARLEAPRLYELEPLPGALDSAFLAAMVVRAERDGRGLRLEVELPPDWLADPARRWPVVIDPSIRIGEPLVIDSSPSTFQLAPEQHHWNAVALSSAAADWELEIGGARSAAAAPACEVLLADGHRGAIAELDGTARLSGGAPAPAALQHAGLDALRVGQEVDFDWGAGQIAHLWELDVRPSDLGLPHTLSVDGPAGLRWALLRPGYDTRWQTLAGAVHGGPVSATMTAVSFSTAGYWALLVCRDGGPGQAGMLRVRWGQPPPPLQLIEGVPARTALSPQTASWQRFEITPRAGAWNVVAALPEDPVTDWDVFAGAVRSRTAAPNIDFVAFDGRAGTVDPTGGEVVLGSGTATALVEHADVHPATLGQDASAPWGGAGDVALVFELEVSTPGTHLVGVDGPGYLEWAVLEPAGSGGASWGGRGGRGWSSGIRQFVDFHSSGTWAVVVLAHATVPAPAGQVRLTFPPPLALVQGQPVQAGSGGAAGTFALNPQAGHWNAVVVRALDPQDDWDLEIGGATSDRGSPYADFALFDGRAAAVSPTAGVLDPWAALGPALVEHADVHPAAYGGAATAPWGGPGDVALLFEVDVPVTATAQLQVDGPAGLSWAFFAPLPAGSTGASWLGGPRLAASGPHPVSSTPQVVDLHTAGTWAVLVWADAAASLPPAGQVRLSWPGGYCRCLPTVGRRRALRRPGWRRSRGSRRRRARAAAALALAVAGGAAAGAVAARSVPVRRARPCPGSCSSPLRPRCAGGCERRAHRPEPASGGGPPRRCAARSGARAGGRTTGASGAWAGPAHRELGFEGRRSRG